MYFINESLHYQDNHSEKRGSHWQYELYCRVHVIGQIDLGWASFRFWEIPPPILEDVRSTLLRIRYREVETEEMLRVPAKNEQHYHPKSAAGEFEGLISLFTRAHFVLVKGSSTDNSVPLFYRYASHTHVTRSEIDGHEINLSVIQEYFEMLMTIRRAEVSLPESHTLAKRYVKSFVMAARFYHLALSLMDEDTTLAYICLVSSIECMLAHYHEGDYQLKDLNPVAAALIEQAISDSETRDAIERALLKNPSKIGYRFVKYVCENISDHFWEDQTRPTHPFAFRSIEDIQVYTQRVYNARSKAVHQGEPFPESHHHEEMSPSHVMIIGGTKSWNEKELLPSVRAFERLIHHVLLQSMRTRSEQALSALEDSI